MEGLFLEKLIYFPDFLLEILQFVIWKLLQ